MYVFATALAIAFEFVFVKIVTKKHDKDICTYVQISFTGPGLTRQADYSPGTLHRRRPPPLTVSGHDHLHFTKTRLLFTKDGT